MNSFIQDHEANRIEWWLFSKSAEMASAPVDYYDHADEWMMRAYAYNRWMHVQVKELAVLNKTLDQQARKIEELQKALADAQKPVTVSPTWWKKVIGWIP